MEYTISLFIGLFFGSLPTAYIFLKLFKGKDITETGSGNVGAMNFFRISNSFPLAAIIFCIDIFKGILTVLTIKYLFGNAFLLSAIGLFGAVFSHCYSFWIKFRGGRGLATAAGGGLLLSFPLLIIWAVIWLFTYIFRKNTHFGNFTATVLTALLSITSADILIKYSNPPAESNMEYSILITTILLIIVSRHIEPMKVYIKSQNQKLEKGLK